MATKKYIYTQIFLAIFISLGAFFGACMMISDPSGSKIGMAHILPAFQKLLLSEIIFKDFLFPGIALGVINGLTNVASIILLVKRHKYGAISGIVCGLLLMIWTCVQFIMLPFNLMSATFFVLGLLQVINGIILMRKTN